jgi:hypothetical protein
MGLTQRLSKKTPIYDFTEILLFKLDKIECPNCGEDEIENGEDGLLEHYTVCEGEKEDLKLKGVK